MDNQAGLQATQIKLTARQIYMREYNQKYREENKEKRRAYDKKRRNNPEYRKRRTTPEYREKQNKKRKEISNTAEYKTKVSIYNKKRYEADIDKIREYRQTPASKKAKTKCNWKRRGMLFTDQEFERIYNLYLTQELCNACDCVLTRGGACNTRANMDHCHETNLFRHIICSSCNARDNWKKHFC